MAVRKAVVIRIPKAVMPLIGLNILFFILQSVVGAGFTESLLLNSATVLAKPWTLVTSMFLHGGFDHILFNMYALLIFGPLIEQRIGSKKFLEMYFLSGILAGLGFVVFSEFIMGASASALGASGAIMGVLGMTIVLLPKMRILLFFVIPMSMRTAGILFAIIDLLGVFGIGLAGIANIAHLVGMAVGIFYARNFLKNRKNYYKEFARPMKQVNETRRATPRSTPRGKTIELNEDDIENYLKKGRL